MKLLKPAVMNYDWGSREALAELTGRAAPTPEPEAELWMGAHENAPSRLVEHDAQVGIGLDEAISADPENWLGGQVAAEFENRLPFLLKILAPVQALSIQAHPSSAEAASAPPQTYGDSWPKPEALLTLTEFEIFVGTRDPRALAQVVQALGVPQLSALLDLTRAEPDPVAGFIAAVLHLPAQQQRPLAESVVAAADRRRQDPQFGAANAAIVRISRQRPGDIGLVLLLAMEHHLLPPGEYVFIPSGVLHSYVHGVGVEVLANSDNVVRAGLTPKRIDIAEVLRIMNTDHQVRPDRGRQVEGWRHYPVDTPFFRLRTSQPRDAPLAVPDHGQPRILLSLHGTSTVTCPGQDALVLRPGGSCFLNPADHPQVSGEGTLYLVSPGH